jgi:hypothetical protein
VLGKLGRHEHALAIYMSILRDVPRAVEYCDKVLYLLCTRWFKYDRDYLCVNKLQFVPVIFEPPCTRISAVFSSLFVNVCTELGLCFICFSCIYRHLFVFPVCSHVIPAKVWFHIHPVCKIKVLLIVSAADFGVNNRQERTSLLITSKQHFVATDA